jgi:hypothetical protein
LSLSDYSKLADLANCKHLLDVYNTTTIEFVADLIVSHNRIIGNDNSQFEIQNMILLDADGKTVRIDNDLTYLASIGRVFLKSGGDGKPEFMSTLQNRIENYLTARQRLLDEILEHAGISSIISSGSQKTQLESTTKFSNSIETTTRKIDILKDFFSDIIETLLFCHGTDITGNYFFDIRSNLALFQARQLDELIKEVEVGTMTPIDMIMILRNVNRRQATEIYKTNKE